MSLCDQNEFCIYLFEPHLYILYFHSRQQQQPITSKIEERGQNIKKEDSVSKVVQLLEIIKLIGLLYDVYYYHKLNN